MLKQAFIGAFAPFARTPVPAAPDAGFAATAPGGGFAAPAAFDWRSAVSAISGLGRMVAAGLAAPSRAHNENRTMTALSGLNDHTLADIGIHRSQIPALARAVAERPSLDPRRIDS